MYLHIWCAFAGVEDAFSTTPHVLTLSLHKYSPGFFPGMFFFSLKGCYVYSSSVEDTINRQGQ